MKWIHPNVSHAASLAALAVVICVGGCQNPAGGVANPFLAPDRVPPPATRAILPGQAQPYYPGDPLPVMQSGTAPTAHGAALAASASPPMPSADSNLTWSAPGSSAQPTSAPPEPQQLAAVNEPTVAIPTDGDSLRFALPMPAEPEPFKPIAASPIPLAMAPVARGVVPASYTEPVMIDQPTFSAAEPPAPSPWRQPQAAPLALPPPPVPQPMYAQPAINPSSVAAMPAAFAASPLPLAPAPSYMDVSLRAVTSPPQEFVAPSTPRIRLPGYMPAPQTASNDGFRPRSSMR